MQTSAIAKSARLAGDVELGEFCVIGEDVRVGSGSVIGSHVVIHPGAAIGSNVRIDDGGGDWQTTHASREFRRNKGTAIRANENRRRLHHRDARDYLCRGSHRSESSDR